MSGGKADITRELAYKDGKYSLTLTDNNGVLSDYSFAKLKRCGQRIQIWQQAHYHIGQSL